MCGRFSMFTYIKELKDRFKIDDISTTIEPRYNIAPAQKIATVVQRDSRQLVEMKWGLVPSWAKDSKIGNRLINARAETVATKPAFRSAFKKRRCLILADSFFEWQKSGDVKTPMLIRMKSQDTFAMAGLYEYWKMKSGKTLESCAIVTTAANDFMKPIHDRMPVILRPENEDKWLDSELQDVEEITHLLRPVDSDLLEAYEVSTYVNSPRNQDSNVIRPVNHHATRLS
ncbi:MAG: SOS response-associated peptidase [Candidatus Thorarchaeota archaeon]|nr:SOS response-associated peptidase [Candidatus Thorarchaeota archaeon]